MSNNQNSDPVVWHRFRANVSAGLVHLGCVVLIACAPGCSDSNHATKEQAATPPAVATTPAPMDPTILDLKGKDITDLPGDASGLQQVKVLRIACNERMLVLPTSISSFAALEELDADNGNGCQMSLRLTEAALLPVSLKKLNLSGALSAESQLPISHLQALEVLDLSKFKRQQIPVEVFSLKKLQSLRLEYLDLDQISARLGELTDLETLYLCCNEITVGAWPDLTKSKNLRRVELGNNHLTRADQEVIRRKLPMSTVVDFENVWDDGRANEE